MQRGSKSHIRMLLPSRSASTLDRGLSTDHDRDLLQLQADLDLLGERISSLGGDAEAAEGLRFEGKSNLVAAKLRLVEQILRRIQQVDALVLRATEPAMPSRGPGRRVSGRDLHLLPSHLQVVDRLRDLFDRTRRLSVEAEQVTSSGGDRVKLARLEVERSEQTKLLETTLRENKALQKRVEEMQRQLQTTELKLKDTIQSHYGLEEPSTRNPRPESIERESNLSGRLVQSGFLSDGEMTDGIFIDKHTFIRFIEDLAVSSDGFISLWREETLKTATRSAKDAEHMLEIHQRLTEVERERDLL